MAELKGESSKISSQFNEKINIFWGGKNSKNNLFLISVRLTVTILI